MGLFNNPIREMTAEVKVHFTEGQETFSGDDIYLVDLLSEASSVSESPLGSISSKELTVALDNSGRSLNPTESPQVKPGLKIEPDIIIDDDGTPVKVPLGVYWCGDWDTPSDGLQATTTAHDRLRNLVTLDTPQIPPMVNTTIGEMYGRLFRALGLEWYEYIISPALSQRVKVGWFPRDRVRQSLELLSEAGNSYVTVDRYNRIVAMPNRGSGDSIANLDDGNIFTINNPQKLLDIYTAVKVIYRLPFIKDANDELVKVDEIEIPPGTTTLDRIDYHGDDVPVRQIDWVHIFGTFNQPERYEVSVGDADSGTFKLGDGEDWTGDITWDASEDTVKTALEAIFGAEMVDMNQDIDMNRDIDMNQELDMNGQTKLFFTALLGNIFADVPFDISVSKQLNRYTITFSIEAESVGMVADFDELSYTEEQPYIELVQEYEPPMKSQISGISYGATDITVTVYNPSDYTETVSLRVKGIGTGFHPAHRIAVNQEKVDEYGRRELSLENPLIQNKAMAQQYSEEVLEYVSDPLAHFKVKFRGDPNLDIGDIITVQSDRYNIPATPVMIRKMDLSFAGGLKADIDARKVS